ncbi:MAG TPA: ABC transporter substrate-binding protein [Mycobacteriales bacterium]|nr:ABC transporter substrate-binding protein [Mycobacteriales bacterium]
MALLAGPAALSACAGDPQALQGPLRPVQYGTPAGPASVLLSWFAIADRLGYFAEEGVESTVKAVPAPLPLVQAGKLQASVQTPAELLPFLAQNPASDLMVVWTSVPRPFLWTVVPATSTVRDFSELKGKTLACLGPGGLWWFIDAMCTQSGLRPGDVKKAVVPAGAALVAAFRKGEIDAGIYPDAQVVQANEQLRGDPIGPLRVLPIPASLQKTGGTTNILKRSTLEKNGDFYAGYLRALVKGFTFLNANVPAGISIHLDAFPTLRQPNESRRQTIDRLAKELQPRLDVSGPPDWATEKHPWGWTYKENLSGWEEIIPVLAGKKLDLAKLYTNELVSRAHDFEAAEIVKAARAHPVE